MSLRLPPAWRLLALTAALALPAPALAADPTPPTAQHTGSSSATTSPTATVWGCHPDAVPNPCTGSLETTHLSSTLIQPRKVAKVDEPTPDPAPAVDCFYVYPTVTSYHSTNAPRYIGHEIAGILKYEAARFSQHCRVFAPIYRQTTLTGILGPLLTTDPGDGTVPKTSPSFTLAYQDVRDAWRDYLTRDNAGRGVVLIGHSQGATSLIRLLREEIDPVPQARETIVSAILAGGNFTTAAGSRTGGDLEHLPTCAAPGETGCVVAYSLYGETPTRGAVFGRAVSSLRSVAGLPTGAGDEVACVNPAELSGDGGQFTTLVRSEQLPGPIGVALKLMYYGVLAPKATTPWIRPGDRYRGTCVRANGAHVLRVRAASPWTVIPFPAPWPDWGLHQADVNLPLGNLVSIVGHQSRAWAATHPTM